ncbi:Hypothetical protein OINT_2000485 [Brucella intermedia LMG 3301]|uniref:Uncharacterized protein n=1 Tax=Brucella intermedia LMG 3301 TaxID=641118 RepID=C4WN26_9HYPH|nr:Hypothetical protein OINT_2000485 [Brucella intermedia LMG 3301]KAB2670525.1 hypothetical protein F9K77_11015 [Ochrobactrum sp. LMG 5442]KAB2695040.1 hypothetical protein F9K72_11440 [Brucella intermedia]OOC65047.1 hypothetical protein AS855_12990 [Brucella intermedia M86]KAB2717202.1 hypothetical protein F9K75_14210 [Brucella intermedia]
MEPYPPRRVHAARKENYCMQIVDALVKRCGKENSYQVEFIGEDGETVCVSFRHDSEEELSRHDAIASALAKMAPLTAYGAAFISILSANKLNTAATAA